MKRLLLPAFFCTVLILHCHGQEDLPVDMHTGTPVINIPLWTVKDHELSQAVGIYYNAGGLKLEQSPVYVGLGWELFGSGRITREVRGLPDDFDGANAGIEKLTGVNHDDRRGWLRTMVGTSTRPAESVGAFVPASDLSSVTCTDESADFTTLTAYRYFTDTEPDIFHYSCGGISGSFVFDNSTTPQIRLIPYRDVKIEYTVSQRNDIIAFTITTNDGTVYHFGRPVLQIQSCKYLGEGEPEYFQGFSILNRYRFEDDELLDDTYSKGDFSYNSQWMLTKMSSVTGAEITYHYSEYSFDIRKTLRVNAIGSPPVHDFYQRLEEQRLNLIQSSTGEQVRFQYEDSLIHAIQVIDQRKSPNTLVKEFLFTHHGVDNQSDLSARRYFLESITERSGDAKLPPYKFNYTGVNFLSSLTTLPSFHSKAKDLWGYYNGKIDNASLYPQLYVYPALDYPDKIRAVPIPGYAGEEIVLPGANRATNPVVLEIGSLNKIQYPLGGSLHISYEPNTYYDSIANRSLMGGGLRVMALTVFDGIHVDATIRKEFTYEEQPGKSSGRLLASPVFYLPRARSGSLTYQALAAGPAEDLWKHLLARTEDNLAEECVVRYKKVTVKKPGSGWSTLEFDLPATAGRTSSGDWVATQNRFARNGNCEDPGITPAGGAWRFPFAPNPNFSHARGLPLKKSDYNENGTLVKETSTTYQYLYKQGTAPFKVWGLSFEKYPESDDAYFFGKYFLLTDMVKVPLAETVKLYDENNNASFLSQTTEFLYESINHKLMTGTRTTNSDGTVYTTHVRYPLDFGTIPMTTDKAAAMIGQLQTTHRNSVAIEAYSTIQKPGDVQKVVGASMTTFNDFGGSTPLPEYNMVLRTAAPVADFAEANVQLVNGQHKLVTDPRYDITNRITAYTPAYKMPVSAEDPRSLNVGGTLWGYNTSLPVAQVTYATPDQVAFSDFETTSNASFTESAQVYGAGHTGQNAVHPSVTLTRTVSRAEVSNYKLTFWIKTNGTPVSFVLTLKNEDGTSTLGTTNFTANSITAGAYAWIEKLIPVSGIPPASRFQVILAGQLPPGTYVSSKSLMPVIDDVAFYPEHAELTSSTYLVPYGTTSVTDHAGISAFQEYDPLGRLKLTRDQDKNIRIKNTYRLSADPDVLASGFSVIDPENGFPMPSVPLPQRGFSALDHTPLHFIADEEDDDGNVIYEWDFGSGFISGPREIDHIFLAGIHDVKLRVSRTGFATVTGPVVQVRSLLQLQLCAEGVKTYNPLSNTTTVSFPDCALITSTPAAFATLFRFDDSGFVPAGTIQWWIRDIGADRWTLLPGNSSQVGVNDIDMRNAGFEVRCEVENSTGIIARSNILQVQFSY